MIEYVLLSMLFISFFIALMITIYRIIITKDIYGYLPYLITLLVTLIIITVIIESENNTNEKQNIGNKDIYKEVCEESYIYVQKLNDKNSYKKTKECIYYLTNEKGELNG